MFRIMVFALFALIASQFGTQEACAHFLFAHVVRGTDPRIELHFAESAWDFSSNQRMVGLMAPVEGWLPDGRSISFVSEPACMTAPLPAGESIASTGFTYGMMTRGEAFLLQYHAKGTGDLESASRTTGMDAEIIATPVNDERLMLKVLFKGEPAADAEIIVPAGGRLTEQLKTDAEGQVEIDMPRTPLYSFRAMVPETRSGVHKDQAYDLVRHYTTLTVHGSDDIPGSSDGLAWAILHDAYASSNAYFNQKSPWNASLRMTSENGTVQCTVNHDGERLSIQESNQLTTEQKSNLEFMEVFPHPQTLSGLIVRFEEDRQAFAGSRIEIPELNMSFMIKDRNIDLVTHDREGGMVRTDITNWSETDGIMLPEQFVVTRFNDEGEIMNVSMIKQSFSEQNDLHIPANLTINHVESRKSTNPVQIRLSNVTHQLE